MLAVDIGNTFTRIVAFDGDGVAERLSFPTRELELARLRAAFAAAAGRSGSACAWVASVVPSANALVDAAAERAGLERRFIKPGTDFIMPHRLSTPATTGVDRLLSAMAAGERHFGGGQNGKSGADGYVVVQCGSAATVDHVDGGGFFRGGYIIPGPGLWLSGLSGGAQLPDFSAESPDWESVSVGDNTRDAMMNGMHVALPIAVASAAMLIGPGGAGGGKGARGALPVVVTGGWGGAVLPYIQSRAVFDQDLLLHGLRLFAGRGLLPGGEP